MTEEDGELTVAQRLGRLLDRGLLPAGGPAEAAERLIERLERPARVALLGLPGSGKSSILNLLAGTIVVPESLRLPTIVVQHGVEERMLCTLADGRVEVISGRELQKALPLNPALITLEMDLPALKVIGLLEVSAGPMEAEQRRAALWASKRADILIWCTTSYLPKEQVVWDSLPDAVKDNGFLFLTKVDLLGTREAAVGMLERVEARAGEEFRQVLSISAKQARAAMPPGGPIDRDLFRDSGAAAVITTIKTRVQMAQRADTDMAELLVARHVEAGEIVARRFAEPDPEAATTTPKREWAPPPEKVENLVAAVIKADAAPGETAKAEPPLPEADAEPEPVLEAVVTPAPEPPAEPESEPEQELAAESAPETEPAREEEPQASDALDPDEPEEDLSAAPAPAAVSEPEPSAAQGSKRFADRIKELPTPSEAPSVPLRTTWKSRSETATPAAPEPQATPRKDAPKPTPRGRDAAEPPAESGPDDAAIASMLASAAAMPTEQRMPRDRSQPKADPEPAAEAGAADRPARTQLFGARKATAEADKPASDTTTTPERAAEPLSRAPAPAPRVTEQPQPVSPEDLATPRAAVLRERRPDAPGAEKRERPRISARVVSAAPPRPAAPQPVSAVEQGLLDRAVALIAERAAELEQMIDPMAKPPVDMILDHGRETTEQVIEVLSRGVSTELRRINSDLSEVQDLIMLMQLEKGHAPADDAMTLILQIRRDLETLRAA